MARKTAKTAKNNPKKRANTNNLGLKIVPDTSILIEGALSEMLEKGNVSIREIIIPEAVVAELESQSNRKREIGYQGLAEIEKLQELAKIQKFTVRFGGERPGSFEITYAKSGEIDSLIRSLAETEGATLYTADVVQHKVARAKGIDSYLFKQEYEKPKMDIEKFFDDTTMSIHIKENVPITAKRGRPGGWEFITVRKKTATRSEIEEWSKQIVSSAKRLRDGFIEIERKGSTIAQIGRYRIVVTRPPFSDGMEITAVRPVKRLSLEDYEISEKLKKRVDEQAEGMLIAGAPGHGKSTFAQALAEHYAKGEKVIKTVEAPRDLQLTDEITQYAISHGSSEEIHDILLLSRPDYTFFDEMRNTDDFKLFADMRLSGVGMIGVMHATKTIDAIQRFLGRIELGVIPHVVDTVIFIKEGAINSIYAISMTVKVPSGMSEADLARPVVEVHDFESGKLVFEIYTFGEQTMVIPVSGSAAKEPVHKFAEAGIQRFFEKYARSPKVEVKSANKVQVTVSEKEVPGLIGKGGENIQRIEKELGMSIDVSSGKEDTRGAREKAQRINFSVSETKTSIVLDIGKKNANVSVDIYADDEFLMTAHASKKGMVKLSKRNKMTKILLDALDEEAVDIFKAAS